MSNISSAYINAILADAAYIDMETGIINIEEMKENDDLPTRMTSPLAKFIADNFEVARLRAGSRRFRPMACMRKAARAKRAGGHGQQDGRKAECAAYFAPFLIA